MQKIEAICDGENGCGKRFFVTEQTRKLNDTDRELYFTCPHCLKTYVYGYTNDRIEELKRETIKARILGRKEEEKRFRKERIKEMDELKGRLK